MYAPALEAAAHAVFMVWLRAMLRDHVMLFGRKKQILIKIKKRLSTGWWT
jgi:hypothetical protein